MQIQKGDNEVNNDNLFLTRCPDCGAQFQAPHLEVCGREVFPKRFCERCVSLDQERVRSERNREHIAEMERSWAAKCPPLYRHTNRGRLPLDEAVVEKILRWRPDERPGGLGLSGAAGIGKRRLLFLLARDLHFVGFHVSSIRAVQFETVVDDRFDDERKGQAKVLIRRLEHAGVLLLLDLGMERLSAAGEVALHDLIQTRAEYERPILWTSQFNGDELLARFRNSQERGKATISRLVRSSECLLLERVAKPGKRIATAA